MNIPAIIRETKAVVVSCVAWLLLTIPSVGAFAASRDDCDAKALASRGDALRKEGRHEEASTIYEQALACVQASGGPPAELSAAFTKLGLSLKDARQPARAEEYLLAAVSTDEKALGPNHLDVARSLSNLASFYNERGQYAKGEPFAVRALAIREKALGPEHPEIAANLGNLAILYRAQGQFAKAEPLLLRAIAIQEKVLGPERPELATNLNGLALLYRDQGQYAKSEPLFLRAIAIFEKTLGPEHPELATSLNSLAQLYRTQGQYEKAESLFLRAIAIREKLFGPDHLSLGASLDALGILYRIQGKFAKAEEYSLRAVAIAEKALGPDHPNLAAGLNSLAILYREQGLYDKAEQLWVRAIAILEKALGPDHPNVASTIDSLAGIYRIQSKYAQAESLFLRAIAIREKAFGPDNAAVAKSLNNLAVLYRTEGMYAKAEPLFQRALAITEKAVGPDHPDVALLLNNLALLYRDQGRFALAEPLWARALAIAEKAFGPDHPDVAISLNNLALAFGDQKKFAEAEPLWLRALAIREKAFGTEHPGLISTLNNLAGICLDQHRFAEAERLSLRALAIGEKAFGPDHPDLALSLSSLARLRGEQGQYPMAEPLLLRALANREKAFGSSHPEVAESLNTLAVLYLASGDLKRSLETQARCNASREEELRRNLVAGSAETKRLYLVQTDSETDWTLTMQMTAGMADTNAGRFGLEQVLRRKGRALDALVDQIRVLARTATPEDRRLLDELASARAEVARLTFRGPGDMDVSAHRRELAVAIARADALEASVSSRSTRSRAELAPVTLDAVTRALPDEAALVEFAVYRQLNAKTGATESTRYVAWVLLANGDVAWADLGEASKIDAAAAALRRVLRKQPLADVRTEVRPRARDLDALVFAPVRALLAGRAKRLLVAPDGQLSLVPFDTLVDEKGRYATEKFEISYLTSGRDLVRLQTRGENRSESRIVADPDFGMAAPELAGTVFNRLSATADEARALAALLPGARVSLGAAATKRELLSMSGPRVLHVATHGFFLGGERYVATAGSRDIVQAEVASHGLPFDPDEDALLRSGLALAGANLGAGADGILTSLEAAGLDLWGTKLVVLSACDTGVGEVKNGEGVYGLRRALVLAGAETQVMSLWPVSDAGTRDLMIGYYRRLAKGEGRSEAMRSQREKFLRDPKLRHPYYWGSFIVSGAWEPLDTE